MVAAQRDRILTAMADAMAENGYVGTSVAAIIKRAGVSRETFYEQFRSKEACFEAAYERAVRLLLDRITEAARALRDSAAGLEDRMRALLTAYLDGLASEPAYARLYLVEVYAVGPKALARRALLQESFVEMLAETLEARTEPQRFACQALVSALSAMVTTRVAADDTAGLHALREPMLELVRRSGDLFGAAPAGQPAFSRG